MIISGLNDMTDCKPLGTGAWLDLLQCDAAAGFHAAPTVQWKHRKERVLGYVPLGGRRSAAPDRSHPGQSDDSRARRVSARI
jgi:hypothetical protein